jgi:hypothetical protein
LKADTALLLRRTINSPNSSRMMRIGGPTALAMSLEGEAAETRKPSAMLVKVVSSTIVRKRK